MLTSRIRASATPPSSSTGRTYPPPAPSPAISARCPPSERPLSSGHQLGAQEVHQQPVVEGAVGSPLVLAHDPDRPEPDPLVAADGPHVGHCRVDREPVVAAVVEQEAGQERDRLGTDSPALMPAADEDVDIGVFVLRLVLLVVLDAAGHLTVDVEDEQHLLGRL